MYFTQQEVLMGRKNGSETMKPATFKEKHENLHISSCKRYVDKYLTYQKHPALSILLDLLLLKPGLNIKRSRTVHKEMVSRLFILLPNQLLKRSLLWPIDQTGPNCWFPD